MSGWNLVDSAFGKRFAGRFATKATRFRLAVTAGLALATVGVVTVGAGSAGFADDFFGALGNLFQTQPAYPQYSQSAPQQSYRAASRSVRHSSLHLARHRPNETKSLIKPALSRHEQPVRLGRKSMCVRLCDGFAFPIGTYHGDEDRTPHEATCQSECPGARTALYVLPNGSDQIGDAVDVKSGRNYSQMPAAFHYTTFLQDACTCHPHEGNRISSLLHDFTLRRGDAVMTKTGFKVFHGDGRFPHRQNDFVALEHSRDIQNNRRATFHSIERASAPIPFIAQIRPSKAAHDAQSTGTDGLEKQASLTP